MNKSKNILLWLKYIITSLKYKVISNSWLKNSFLDIIHVIIRTTTRFEIYLKLSCIIYSIYTVMSIRNLFGYPNYGLISRSIKLNIFIIKILFFYKFFNLFNLIWYFKINYLMIKYILFMAINSRYTILIILM